MRTPIALPAAAAALVLALAAPAAAKQLESLEVCGPTTCIDRTADAGDDPHRLMDAGAPYDGAVRAAPFVQLRIGIGDGSGEVFGHTTLRFVPDAGLLLAEDGTWLQPPPDVAALLRRLSGGVDRFPAARLPGTTPVRATPPPAA
ncbi:MAG: hypothetical protein HZB46_17935, partial [Solirubrobacterales bacterium]|nr:hypothetical protein [Solirubrobacterales bacterium]